MADIVHLAMQDTVRAHDLASERFTDGLMAKTDAEKRYLPFGRGADQIDADSRLSRIAWARRDHDTVRVHRQSLWHVKRVIAPDGDFSPGFAQIMHEVPGEAVVIVDQKDHCLALASERFPPASGSVIDVPICVGGSSPAGG